MATRPRLGKGLGALFPSLPGDQEQHHDEENGAVRAGDAAHREATKHAPAVAQPSPEASADVSTVAPSDAVAATSDVSRETSTPAPSSSKRQRSLAKRASVPALGDLTHPSDMFFGGEASGSGAGAGAALPHEGRAKSAFDVTLDDLLKPSPTSLRAVVGEGDASSASAAPNGDAARADDSSSHETAIADTQSGEAGSTAHGDAGSGAVDSQARQDEAKAEQEQQELKPVAGGYLAELKVDDIGPNAHQPRTIFDEDDLMELSDSIKEVGVLQPIVVRRRPKHQIDVSRETSASDASSSPDDGKASKNPFAGRMDSPYELIMGERRWRATQLAGLKTIPAIVKTTADDDMLRDALLENLHRVALNPLEEAAAYQQMIKEFGLTQEQLSKSVSKSRPQIANTLRLLQLPPSVQKKVASGVLSAGHARALLGLDSEEDMDKLAVRIIGEGLSVRSTEEIVAMMTMDERKNAKPAAKRRTNVWSGSAIEQSLNDRFDTKVAIKGTKKHGRIEITFSSPEDMQRILSLLDPEQHASDGWV